VRALHPPPGPGIFAWLPLGLRVKRRIETIIREEMDGIGAQEVHFRGLLRARPTRSHRSVGQSTVTGSSGSKDRKGADYLLAPDEEVFTPLVKDLCSSYKDLPSIYQIQDKYRDEARPRRSCCAEFTMKTLTVRLHRRGTRPVVPEPA
jgi:prolyl-tRNA synthetase